MSQPFGPDAYAPKEIAARVSEAGVAKARQPQLSLTLLGLWAGAFLAVGSLMFTLVASDASLGLAATRMLGGLAFSLGMVLVTVAGAELFTGNNLIVMAWASGRVSTAELLRNGGVACAANFLGAAALALPVWLAARESMKGGAVGRTVVGIAIVKVQLPLVTAFYSGVLCNVLVCMSVWLAQAGHSVTDKVLGVMIAITAFVAAGFKHSIANVWFFAYAALLGVPLGWGDTLRNLVPVVAGNMLGGSVLVALVYGVICLRAPVKGDST